MNKLITTQQGGFPLVLEDVRFLDDAYREAFSAILSSLINQPNLNNTVIILSGINRNKISNVPGNFQWTYSQGFVAINGEICQFDGLEDSHSLLYDHYFVIEETNDPEGTKIFKNGNTYETYKVRKAKLERWSIYDPTTFRYDSAFTFTTSVASRIRTLNTAWATLPGSLMQGSFSEGQVSYMRDALGFVYFRGIWHSTFLENDQLLGTLPGGFRPQVEMNYRLDASSTTISGNCLIRIQTNGQIRAVGMPTEEIRFNQIPPFLAVF